MATFTDAQSSHSQADTLSAACASFKAALQQQNVSRIEDYLAAAQPGTPTALIVALAEIEIRHLIAAGQRPEIEEYLRRFPAAGGALQQALAPYLSSLDPSLSTVAHQGHPPASQVSAEPLDKTRVVGRYQLVKPVGRGAFGEVWEAYDPILKRPVALKLLRRDRTHSQTDIESLIAEGQRLSHLDHPGIVPVFDAAYTDDGHAYLVSKFMSGGTLEARLRSGPLALSDAVSIVISVALGLQHAHQHQIVHRDIKPSNILFDSDGIARLGDFGLAASAQQLLSESPSAAGTPSYMSPEQARGETHLCGPTSDIYSLGVVLYRALTGQLPLLGMSWSQFYDQIQRKEPPSPRSINPRIPASLESITLRCLRKEATDRPKTALEIAEELQAWLTEETAGDQPPEVATSGSRRVSWAIPLLTISVILLAVAALVWNPKSGRQVAANTTPRAILAEPKLVEELLPSWKNPEVVAWSPKSQHEKYGFDAVHNCYRFDAFHYSLFQASEVSGDRVQIRLDATWDDDQGKSGVFWGLTWANPSEGHCLAAIVGRDTVGGPLELEIRELTLVPEAGRHRVTSDKLLMFTRLDEIPFPTGSIEVLASRQEVESIRLNGDEVLRESVQLPQAAWLKELRTNPVGFLAFNTSMSVTEFVAQSR